MKKKERTFNGLLHYIIHSVLLTFSIFIAKGGFAQGHPERLLISKKNPHVLATADGRPVFINSFTVWMLLRNGSRKDIEDLLLRLKDKGINGISMPILDLNLDDPGKNYYGDYAFQLDNKGLPNPLMPVLTPGRNPGSAYEYDFWDHLDFVIAKAYDIGMYVFLYPAWGDWFSGSYNGKPNKYIIFNEKNAYSYGLWIGRRYGLSNNVVWMLGGDRSAVYGSRDYRAVYASLAEGISEGVRRAYTHNHVNSGEFFEPLISYHPRKWAPNSSEWFHNEKWLSFNSIQDTPYDQIVSVSNDYGLKPVKPTWLCEGRYEGAITDWGVRYQAWQTVLSGAFGHTYGSDAWKFPSKTWRQYMELPGLTQMGYLYKAVRSIWTDRQFLSRMPDQSLIIGEQGSTIGDGNTRGDGDGGGEAASHQGGHSDRITAMRGSDGKWAIIYTAAGNDIHLDMTKLKGKLDAYWFNPRTGKWWVNNVEHWKMQPFKRKVKMARGDFVFKVPVHRAIDNDWVLILK